MKLHRQITAATAIAMVLLLASCGGDSKSKSSSLPSLEDGTSSTSSQTTTQSSNSTATSSTQTANTNQPAARQMSGQGGADFVTNLLTEAAEKLEVEVDALVEALGQPMDIEAAAEKLKISVEKLTAALPEQLSRIGGGQSGQGGFGDFNAIFKESAEKLGIEVEALIEALGRPFDLEGAAEKLKISVEDLTAALPEQITSRMGGTGGRQPQGQQQ